MTECKHYGVLIQGYIDNELDAATVSQLLDHLAKCPECRSVYQADHVLAKAMHDSVPYHRIPAGLSRKVIQNIRSEARQPSDFRSLWKQRWLPLIPVAVLVCSLCLYIAIPDIPDGQLDEAVSEHVRSLMENHLTDVVSSDRHTVKPWFAGKLDFSPPVYDFAAQGYPLLGGRLDYLEHRNVAALAYRHNKHIINVFVMPETGADKTNVVHALRGYNVISWRKNGLAFSAVSDLNVKELEDLTRLFTSSI